MLDFSVAILAGGKSSRMGRDKSFVELDSKPLIEHVISRTSGLGQQSTFIVTNGPNDYAHLGLRMAGDILPDKGSLGGIYTAIHESPADYTLVIACDMPFVNPDVLLLMLVSYGGHDVVVPRVDGYPQGLHALYRKTCLPHIREKLDANRLKVIGFYESVNVRYLDEDDYQSIDPHGTSFTNLNTPDELTDAQSGIKKSDP